MKPRARRALPLVLLIAAAAAVAQTPVGELVDVTGRVDIDAFATLEFLSARERERVYQQSAVRLADGAVAWLLIDSQRIPLTAGVNRVSDHLAAREKRQRKPLFRALAEILFGTGKGSETQVALGTRASEASSDDGFGFFDDGQTLDSAEKHLGGGEYEEALAELQALLDPDLAAPGHVDYLYGSAYFGLGNFDAAYQRLGRALDDVEANSIEVPHFLPALLMRRHWHVTQPICSRSIRTAPSVDTRSCCWCSWTSMPG